jgi:hypothetical protein
MRSVRLVYGTVNQTRAKVIIGIPYYKGFVDRSRAELSRPPVNYPQPTAEEKEKMEAYDAKRAAKAAKGKGGKGGRAGRGRGRGRGVNAYQTADDEEVEEEEEEMCTAEQMKALRVELGLNVHSLHAAGEMNPAGCEYDQWQCVRVQRVFEGMGEQRLRLVSTLTLTALQ